MSSIFANVHLCQGVLLGNVGRDTLGEMLETYDPQHHPIIGPLLTGGPDEVIRAFDLPHEDGYVDACHLCYESRCALRERFPEHLGPPNVYGAENRN